MSCLFGNLVPVRREKEILYCFLEARVKLFSNINDHRLSYAMTFLGINTLLCTEVEHLFLGRKLCSQFAPFKLLSEQNLARPHRLLFFDFSEVESRTPPSHVNIQFPFATNQRAEFSPPGMPLKPWHYQSGVEETPRYETFEDQSRRDNNSAHDHSASRLESVSRIELSETGGLDLESAVSSVQVESSENGQSSEFFGAEYSTSVDVSEEKKDEKPGITLSEAEMSPDLRSELCEIRKFYSDELNCNREGIALQNTTIDKMLERTTGFLWFLKNIKKNLIQSWFTVPIRSWCKNLCNS